MRVQFQPDNAQSLPKYTSETGQGLSANIDVYLDSHSWIPVALLLGFAVAYCWTALIAPYWVGNDAWSNLLPIIQYRISVLQDHHLPLYTPLWYGGRYQWANPLWNFLYLPATLIWLVSPLQWGTRIVYLGHFVFALLAGRKLAGLFLDHELDRLFASIVLASPIFPAFTAGQTEKILSWGWVLLSLYFLLNNRLPAKRRGLAAGITLAIVALTGSNYYTFYAGILLGLLLIALKDGALFGYFLIGASLGLVHLPSVAYLVGQPRGNAASSISFLSVSFPGILSSLAIGIAAPMGWETWAMIGIPWLILFFIMIVRRAKDSILGKRHNALSALEFTFLGALLIMALLATGTLYRGQHLLDTFRVPARALTFVALTLSLFLLQASRHHTNRNQMRIYLLASALQIGIMSFMIRPYGALYSPYDPQAQRLADILKADHARSVWISMQELIGSDKLNDMYIQATLMRNGLGLPNVYYGDMGQKIIVEGAYCGYSFDHLVTLNSAEAGGVSLNSDIDWSTTTGWIPAKDLELVGETDVNSNHYRVYRVVCGNSPAIRDDSRTDYRLVVLVLNKALLAAGEPPFLSRLQPDCNRCSTLCTNHDARYI
jgi:hypothetical protein